MKALSKPSLSGCTLKWIAIITMMIDHTAAAVLRPLRSALPESMTEMKNFLTVLYPYLRGIGRIAFPIFCFLLVEGFVHTRNAARYAWRLFAFALISEIPFDFALSVEINNPHHQNVYFTLLIGLLVMMGMDYFEKKDCIASREHLLNVLIQICIAVGGLYLAQFMYTDYGFKGVLLIEVLYFYRVHRPIQTLLGVVTISWERVAPLAFLPIWFYNGKRGRQHKYFFYWFYPVHLVLLGLMKNYLVNIIS